MVEIQRGVVKGGKRNAISRVFHAKNDQGAIAAWRLDLNRILHIFNVCSVTSACPSLIISFQTELAINTNVVVSDVHRGVMNTHTIVSDVRQSVINTQTLVSDVHQGVSELQRGVADAHTIVSDIHRTIVQSQERADGKNRLVSHIASTPFITEPTLTTS